jgi:hypothetical protein
MKTLGSVAADGGRQIAMTTTTRQELLTVLAQLSDACPELRFGQLIANLSTLSGVGNRQWFSLATRLDRRYDKSCFTLIDQFRTS